MENTLHKEVKKKIQDGIDMTVATENEVYWLVATNIAINMAAKTIHELSHRIVNT